MERIAGMTAWKKKLGAALGALALVIGAVPGTVGMAAAYESPSGGQHLDKGRFPRTIHIVILITITALVAGILAVKGGKDTPASP
jgi:Na+/H+ antiporter NhaD/arsenite permease-like protein